MSRILRSITALTTICVVTAFASTAVAQSHGIAQERFLNPQSSKKSSQLHEVGLAGADQNRNTVHAASVSGLRTSDTGKSIAAHNELTANSAQFKINSLQTLSSQADGKRHVSEDDWATAFEGMQVTPEPSKGKLPAGASLLQSRSASAKSVRVKKSAHGMAGDGWFTRNKVIEGLK